jgi:hypothetical protein
MGTLLRYPGRRRVDDFRARLNKMRQDTDRALVELDALHDEIDGLRDELRSLMVTVGDQLAGLAGALERLQDGDDPTDEDRPSVRDT